ncbi:MAG: hypothetical protein JKY65_25815 [Planctomycetes bacterium]|nr:hypothetical protein [Planctomycetota bacterium]
MSDLSIRCACGTTTRASVLLAGGPIPCIDCGRANLHTIKSKGAGSKGKRRKTGPTKRPAGARALADRPRRSVRQGRGVAKYERSLLVLGVALAVASGVGFLLRAGGPEPLGVSWYILGSLFTVALDLGVIVVCAAVIGLSVGTLSESGLKVALIGQLGAALWAGALLMGGAAPLLALLVFFFGSLSLFVRLFDWSWGEALIVFLLQVTCHVGVHFWLLSVTV